MNPDDITSDTLSAGVEAFEEIVLDYQDKQYRVVTDGDALELEVVEDGE